MKLKRLQIENFGPHRSLDIEFGPGINVIRGQNRAGKTWILRALDMVFFNEGGLECITYGQKHFRIVVTMDDGSVIERYRDRAENAYVVNGTRYTAVGSGPFNPVLELTGIRAVQLDGKTESRPNIKMPTDPRFFVIGETPQKQAQILARLVGADVLESAASGAISDQRKAADDRRKIEALEAESASEVARYDGIDGVMESGRLAQDKVRGATELQTKETAALRCVERTKNLTVDEHSARHRLDVVIDGLSSTVSGRAALSKRYERQQAVLGHFRNLGLAYKKQAEVEASLESIGLGDEFHRRCEDLFERARRLLNVEPWLALAVTMGQKVDNLTQRLAVLDKSDGFREQSRTIGTQQRTWQVGADWIFNLVKQTNLQADVETGLARTVAEIDRLQKTREQTLEDAGVCPVCGRPM